MSARVTTVLRVLAVAIVVAAFIDPALAVRRPAPVAVDFHVEPDSLRADGAKRALVELLGPEAAPAPPVARVVIGDRVEPVNLPANVPVYAVTLHSSPNVRIASVAPPPRALPGRSVVLNVGLESSGLRGTPAVLALEESGIELTRAKVNTLTDGIVHAQIRYAPSKIGVSIVRVVVRPIDGEAREDDNAVDVAVTVADRQPLVAVYEPRPSWSAGFARRALESDRSFRVSLLANVSRGIAALGGEPPVRLTREQLERFDAVLVGAPEELRAREIELLREYARVRGGAVILLPDRRPSGPFVSLVPAAGFDEVLLEKPASLGAIESGELALPREPAPGWFPLAMMPQPSGRPVVLWWPLGDGRIVYSGALDAWRYRARAEESFARFWRDAIGIAALASPPKLSLEVVPAVMRPGDRVDVRLRLRRTERAGEESAVDLPSVTAEVSGQDGIQPIRLWPSAETGLFEGTYRAGGAGLYTLRASAGGTLTGATAVRVTRTAARAPVDTRNQIATLVAATGGITVAEDNLPALVRHVRGRAAPEIAAAAHPMRSGWWIVAFAGLLCAEWAIRRRHGLR
jgi:hypothetical protein